MVGSNYWNSSKSPHVLRIQVAHGQRPCGPPGAPFNCCAIQVLSKLNWPGLTAACVRIHSTQRGSLPKGIPGKMCRNLEGVQAAAGVQPANAAITNHTFEERTPS